MTEKTFKTAKNQLIAKWFVCRITSSKKSAKYGIRFSYPLYIAIVTLGILLVNPYILFTTALIALLGIILPMHPFDYIYNYTITPSIRTDKIPGRGSELQVTSAAALLFNLGVIIFIMYGIHLNYFVLALIYIIISIFFICLSLFTDNFSFNKF